MGKKRYEITHKKHPHFGMKGELANDQDFPMRTFVNFAPMFAIRLEDPCAQVKVVYVDDGDVTEIDGLDT